jgi:hypothetical protein
MANVRRMWEFFTVVDDLIENLSEGEPSMKDALDPFFFRVLTICDGLEGPTGWEGISLVAPEDLPEIVQEINDEFLHDAWSGRQQSTG